MENKVCEWLRYVWLQYLGTTHYSAYSGIECSGLVLLWEHHIIWIIFFFQTATWQIGRDIPYHIKGATKIGECGSTEHKKEAMLKSVCFLYICQLLCIMTISKRVEGDFDEVLSKMNMESCIWKDGIVT